MQLNDLQGTIIESIRNLEVYHGGSPAKGKLVTYYTTSEKMAQSYVEMFNDRFGNTGRVHRSTITISNPAPPEIIDLEAKKVGVNIDDYTPASVFDSNLQGYNEVARLVIALKKRGYDGAILKDIGYGIGIVEDVYIVFS